MFRIVFVLVAAIVITLATVILGHYLQKMVDDAGGTEEENDYLGDEIAREEIDTSLLGYDSRTVFGCGINVTGFENNAALESKIIELSSYYDTLNISITDASGNFIYTSPALCELLKLPVPENNVTYELIEATIKSAKAVGMKTCIIMAPSDYTADSSAIVDATIADEMASLGADEILFRPKLSSDDYINYNIAVAIRSYFFDLREEISDGLSIGIVLPSRAYEKVSNTKQLQMIASVVTFMAIEFDADVDDTPDTAHRDVTNTISSLIESFRTYNLRIILRDTNEDILAASYTAAINNSINNIAFTTSVIPTSLSYSENNNQNLEAESEPETESPADRTNPYAEVEHPEEESESSSDRPWY